MTGLERDAVELVTLLEGLAVQRQSEEANTFSHIGVVSIIYDAGLEEITRPHFGTRRE